MHHTGVTTTDDAFSEHTNTRTPGCSIKNRFESRPDQMISSTFIREVVSPLEHTLLQFKPPIPRGVKLPERACTAHLNLSVHESNILHY